jgi:hypothetical protein
MLGRVRLFSLCGLYSNLDTIVAFMSLKSDFDFLIIIFYFAGCVNLSFAYVEGESLLMALKDVALSSGRLVYC